MDSTRTIFVGSRRAGQLAPGFVAAMVKDILANDPAAKILVFDDATGAQVDVDFRPAPQQAETPAPPRGRGRPKLGVEPREVTLLPRHWDWLAAQPGGASAALRKLVEKASKDSAEMDRRRAAREAAYRFLSALAGDFPGFEEATRALFAADREGFEQKTADWPRDVALYAQKLAFGAG